MIKLPCTGLPARAAAALCVVAACLDARATGFAFRDAEDGISCKFYEVGLKLAWPQGHAQWFDAQGARGGPRAFDVQTLGGAGTRQVLRWDVSALLRAWADGSVPNEGLMLATMPGQDGGADFHSRESPDPGLRPSLRVVHADGGIELLPAAADAHLDCTTYTGLGAREVLHVAPRSSGVLRFDLSKLRRGDPARARTAELILVRTMPGWSSPGALGVFRLTTPWHQTIDAPPRGLAADYRADIGLEKHADVMLVERMQGGRLGSAWTQAELVRSRVVATGAEPTAAPPQTRSSLQVTVPRGENLGLDLRYDFKPRHKSEPDEVFMRYYLRVGREWVVSPDSGKLPGFGGTYNRAAWGGRAWDGHQGWSARGGFLRPAAGDHPARNRLPLGSYVYHSGSNPPYGEVMAWAGGGGAAFIEAGRWYCIEQHVRLNTPGRADGVLRAWVDGRPVFERRDLRLRDTPALHVENAWMNVYLGGSAPAPEDMALQIDHIVIARAYIGPMPR
jgi:hypothetical protein